jgi:putative redox protein
MSVSPGAGSDPEEVVVEETGVGRFQVEARAGSATLLIDEPESVGGLGSGPNPYDLLAAALGACTAMTVRLYANQKAWPLTHARVSVVHHRATLQAKDVFERKITLEGDLDDAQRTRLLQIAERCPVHLTLSRGSDIQTSLTPPAPPPTPSASPQHKGGMDEAAAG